MSYVNVWKFVYSLSLAIKIPALRRGDIFSMHVIQELHQILVKIYSIWVLKQFQAIVQGDQTMILMKWKLSAELLYKNNLKRFFKT